MENLREKVIAGAKWSLIERAVNIGFEFAVGVILARLLLPSDFGTVAIITVVISFSLVFVNSGFNQSLVRDLDATELDYSTIFLFNLVVGSIIYLLLFLVSGVIADFYEDSGLVLYIKILGLTIIISSLTFVQRVRLTRALNFKTLGVISIISSFISGIVALILAINGFGVWSLIGKTIIREVLQSLFIWFLGKWKPTYTFSFSVLKKHFSYGINFLVSAIVTQAYSNILALTIGKIFSLQTLGYYNRAQLFSNIVSENIGSVMTGVSFPALAKVQNDEEKFVKGVRLLLKQTVYIIGILMIGIFFTSKTFIPLLLGQQWIEAAVYLQYLCVIGFFGVLNSILVNSISVTGRSNIYLYFQIWALCLNVITLIIGYHYGIENMLLALVCFYAISYILISKVFQYFFSYSLLNQLLDFRKIIGLFVPMIFIGLMINSFFIGYLNLMFIAALYAMLITAYSIFFKLEEYSLIRKLLSR